MKCRPMQYVLVALTSVVFVAPAWADESAPRLQLKSLDGGVPAGEPYRLVQRADNGNLTPLQEGEVPDDGVIPLEGDWRKNEPLEVTVLIGDAVRLGGRLAFDPAAENDALSMTVPPAVGETAPDIAFTELFGDRPVKLSDLRGEFVLLDFWASWCPPCQKPMAKNQALAVAHKEDWKDKVRIVALSLDEKAETARAHVEKKGWTDIYNAFSSEGEPGWFSTASLAFGIWDIPTVVLLDPEGTIIWRGNPNNVDVEELIQDAMKAPK